MTEPKVLRLPLDQVRPDEDQVRKYADQGDGHKALCAAILRWGQLQPIRVRPGEEGRYIIVDGERRYRALWELDRRARTKDPADDRFASLLAIEGDEKDEDSLSRKAIQTVSNMGAELLPVDKARVIAEIRAELRERGKKFSQRDLAETLGIRKGQIRILLDLAQAPAFILDLGKPQTYELPARDEDGNIEEDDKGNTKLETVTRNPLPLTFLRDLHFLFKKLRAFDEEKLAHSDEHKPIAAKTVKSIGIRAQRDEWSLKEVRKACQEARLRINTGEVTPTPANPKTSGTALWIRKLTSLTKKLPTIGSETERSEIVSALRSALDAVETVSKPEGVLVGAATPASTRATDVHRLVRQRPLPSSRAG